MSESGSLAPRGEVTALEPTRNERLVGRRSAESRATVPTIEYSIEVDIGVSLERAAQLRIEPAALLVRACALALRAVPRANCAYRDGGFELYSRVNIGVTIAAPGAYLVPTLYDADGKTVPEIAAELAELSERARAGSLTAPELSGATFTLTPAPRADQPPVTTLAPLVIPPQAAALAAGPVRDAPVVRDGQIVPGRAITIVLACDHRILYGAYTAELLAQIKARLEEASS